MRIDCTLRLIDVRCRLTNIGNTSLVLNDITLDYWFNGPADSSVSVDQFRPVCSDTTIGDLSNCCTCNCCAVLCCAVLCCAVLCCAVLCCAVLCCAVLCCAASGKQQCMLCWASLCPVVLLSSSSNPCSQPVSLLTRAHSPCLLTAHSGRWWPAAVAHELAASTLR